MACSGRQGIIVSAFAAAAMPMMCVSHTHSVASSSPAAQLSGISATGSRTPAAAQASERKLAVAGIPLYFISGSFSKIPPPEIAFAIAVPKAFRRGTAPDFFFESGE
jgi:hypothetical protein